MTERKRVAAAIVLLAFTALFCTLPLFIRVSLPYGHDTVFHVFQAEQFERAIHEGVPYPRWVPDSNRGYGSANFIFYAPLTYYLVTAGYSVMPSLIVSMIVVIWCGFFLSGVSMFFATRGIFGKGGNLISAFIYQILPFHVIDLYLRGTFAELFAYVWFPVILLFLVRLFRTGHKGVFLGLSLSYAALILTHLVSGFIFSLVIGGFVVYHFIFVNRKTALKALLSICLGLGVSSLYLIPVIMEQKYVQIDYIVKSVVGDYRKSFLFMWDMLQLKMSGFYFPLHAGVIVEVLLFVFIVVLAFRKSNGAPGPTGHEMKFFVSLFACAFFLTTPLSGPLWAVLPGFPTLQFPWRWVTMMELSLSFLIGFLFSEKVGAGVGANAAVRRIALYFSVALLAVFGVIVWNAGIPEKFPREVISTTEYTPVWAASERYGSGAVGERVSVRSGTAEVGIDAWEAEKRVISIKATTPALIRIATFYYPGWEARVDRRKAEIRVEKNTGAMLVAVPEGEHLLILKFGTTPMRYYAGVASLLSVAIVLFVCSPLAGVFTSRRTGSGRGPHR